jgi:ACS family D-galactonate transporter-like MFS transporter
MSEQAASATAASLPPYNYKRIWIWLCIGWLVSSADRVITGPVVTWMIQHRVAFMATEHPYELGGLIGSIFFAGYMLTQFPGGYAGDRHGHRTVLVIRLFAAAAPGSPLQHWEEPGLSRSRALGWVLSRRGGYRSLFLPS